LTNALANQCDVFVAYWVTRGRFLSMISTTASARKVAILLSIGDREFTFGEFSMKAGCHLANKNYDF
jgi:hypothetical protein